MDLGCNPGGSDSEGSDCNAGDPGSIPGSGRSPGEGNGNPLQYSCLENPMDRGAWWATLHGVTRSRTQLKRLSRHARCLLWRCGQRRCPILETTQMSFSKGRDKLTAVHACCHSTCVCAKELQSCLTLCNPLDSSPPGSSVHGILQTRILKWVAIPFSRGSS